MSDDDSDKDILAGDSDNENVQPDVPPEELTEKQKKALEKLKKKWRIFLDFLLRHISIVTFKYNTFEREEYPDFVEAMAKAESLRSKLKERPKKLKKGEDETIRCFRQMKITTEMLTEHRHYTEAHRIQKFMNLAGRMRGLGMIARSFMVTLRKGKVRNLDKIKYYFDYWRGFTIRTFDYTDLRVKGTDHNNRINKYQTWPCVIRTSLWLAQKFLKRASDAIEMPLMTEDPRGMQQHMSAAEFVVANRIEALLTKKVQQEAKSFVLGKSRHWQVEDTIHLCLGCFLEIFVWSYNTFQNNFGVRYRVTKYLI